MDPFHVLGGYFEDIQGCIPEGTYLKMYNTLKTIKDTNSHVDLLNENERLTSVNARVMRQRVDLLRSIRDRDVTIQTTVDMLNETRELLENSKKENDKLTEDMQSLKDDDTDVVGPAKKRKFEEIDLTEE